MVSSAAGAPGTGTRCSCGAVEGESRDRGGEEGWKKEGGLTDREEGLMRQGRGRRWEGQAKETGETQVAQSRCLTTTTPRAVSRCWRLWLPFG